MRKTHLFPRVVILLSIILVFALLPRRLANANEPQADDLKSVWERVRQSGSYDFSADVTQTTIRERGALAYGASTQNSRVHMEGETNLESGTLDLTLWNGGGSVLLPETGTQIRIADGQAKARRGNGPWQVVDDFSGLLAPGGDFLSFLVAAKNVIRHEPELISTPVGKQVITRFTFDIDGPQFAAYMRDQLNEQMAARGEIPPGLRLDMPKAYSGMTGQGELYVGEDGLPVGQKFELTFSEGAFGPNVATSTAHIAVTFSQFASQPTTTLLPGGGPLAAKINEALTQNRQALENVTSFQFLLTILAAVLIIVVMWGIIRRSGSRPVYAAVAFSVSFSMLVSPLLRSLQVSAFSQKQAERQATQEAQQAETDTADAWQAALNNPDFDPHASPLDIATTQQERVRLAQNGGNSLTAEGTTSATGDDSKYFDSSCETDPGLDNDGDSLTNLQECLIGTLPGAADTDQDGVDDGLEVAGFTMGNGSGVTWYSNPLNNDTNRDGIPDGAEWYHDADGNGLPDDTDGNGIPDLWDDDNDGDGVPDNLDLSPYSTTKNSNVFDGDHPFQLIVNDLGDGLITKAEFQLAPTNPDHLWYTNNVLDWADNDRQGQMQDADGLTFYDVDNSLDPWPNDLGDVRLVPMLEIEMTGTPNNLPDEETLNLFGISVLTSTNNSVTAYVPVQLVTDDTGDKNVAFHGAMYYRADSSWGNAQSVRLVWLVQALVDVCDTYKNGVCDTYSAYNDLQVIHNYDDEWYLTGMEVSEEHGTNMAIVYEDPAETNDGPLYMNTLSPMVYDLDRTFMAGADCDVVDANGNCTSGNGILDLTVAGIKSRFDHATNSDVSDEMRWGLSNVLSVKENSYESVGLAMMDAAITQTVEILDNSFTSFWSASEPITPTIMFAWEHTYRAVSLSSDHLSWSNNILTVDVATSGTNPVPTEQENGIKWAPYAYSTSPTGGGWNAADINAYWNNLDDILPGYMSGSSDVPTDVVMSKLLYMGMYSGETNIVKYGDKLVTQDYQTTDAPLQIKFASVVGAGIRKAVAFYFGGNSAIERIIRAAIEELDEDISVIKRFTLKLADTIASLFSKLRSFSTVGLGILVITASILLVVAGLYFYRKYVAHQNIGTGWLVAGGIAVGVIVVAVGIVRPIMSMINQVKSLVELGEAADTLNAVELVFGIEGAPSVEYNVLGLLISVTLAAAIFMTLVFSGQVKVGTIAFNTLIAQTIAAVIVALIIFVINLTGIGALLLAVAAVVDIILLALGINFSIIGKLTDAIAGSLYKFDLAESLDVDTGRITAVLANPDDGMEAGNRMIYSFPITTVITETSGANVSLDQFRTNSLVYDLDSFDAYQTGLSTTHGDRANDWVLTTLGGSTTGLITGTMNDTVSFEKTLSAGVNTSDVFYLDMAYDLLAQSCWIIAGCDIKYVDGTSSTEMGSTFIFDVYPATIDGFVDVASWSDGYLRFPDADGDGLLPLGEGGIDPNNSAWDSDGDELSDNFEFAMRSLTLEEGGEVLDPLLRDTDSDGIPDKDELLLATNPATADSDGDGLPDIDEAAHVDETLGAVTGGWIFAYSVDAFTRVWSDPNSPDYDGDGMTDLFERAQDTCPSCTPWADPDNPLLFSPYVYNENPVPIFLSDNTNNGFITPGTSFVYSTTTENDLSDGIVLAGDVALELPDIFSGAPLTAEVALTSGYSQTLVSEISPAVSSSATGILTSSMDLAALEDVVWSWDPVGESSMTPVSGDIEQLNAAAAPGFSDLYVYTALEVDGSGTQYITAYAAGSNGNPSDSNTLAYIDAGAGIAYTAPSVACNDSGVCLVVWGEPNTPNGGEINGFILNRRVDQASLQKIKIAESGVTVSAPSVASDGVNFMVGWSENTGSRGTTKVRKVFADGNFSSIIQVWEVDYHGLNPIGLEWTGSNYLAVWIFAADASMYRAEIDTSLSVGPITSIPGDYEIFVNPAGVDSPLTLSYDPLSQQALVMHRGAYQGLGDFYLSATRFSAAGVSPVINLDTTNDDKANGAACADPINGGWILVWSRHLFSGLTDTQIMYQAIAPDGSLRGSEQVFDGTTTYPPVAIACRAPHPLLDLEFEENASSTVYADSSQYENDATCTFPGCPLGGVEGRFGNGVQFDGVNDRIDTSFSQSPDEFTVEFWMKTTCQDCDLLSHLNGYSFMYLENGKICATATGPSSTETFCTQSGTSFADGDWHHVVHAVDGAYHAIYVDGQYRSSKTFSFSGVGCPTACDHFEMGVVFGNWFDGTLDRVMFHNRRLSSAEVMEAFSAAVTILDLDETAGSTTAFDASNNGFNATCSGSSCPTFGVVGAANTAASFDGSDDYLTISPQARTLESVVYDFEDSNTSGWNNSTLSAATRNGETTRYLGSFGNQTTTLSLSNLPTHDTVTFSFDLYVLGPWAGNRTDLGPDIWEWGHDGASLLHTTFSNQPDSSPNYQTYPASYPFYFQGITLYENKDFSGASETFTGDDSNLSDNTIGNDRASAVEIYGDTAAIQYRDINYSGTSWIMDPKRGIYNVPDNDAVSSLHVFSAAHPPKYSSTGDTLTGTGFSETSAYHVEYTLENHTASNLTLYFKGLSSNPGTERWGVDNVVVEIQSESGSIPLTNSDFTLSAWAKRKSTGTDDFILSQGTSSAYQGLILGYLSTNQLRCGFWGDTLTTTTAYTDTDWHHIACTFDASSRLMTLYRDGVQVAQYTAGGIYSGVGHTFIGKRFDNTRYFGGIIDELSVWTVPLSGNQILELYQRARVEDQSVLHAVAPVQQDSSLLTLDLLLRETATGAGTEAQVVTRTIGIDADSPSVAVLAPINGQYVSGLNALELSGSARDPTSYVNAVEVQIDGGGWETAAGTESWNYFIPANTLDEGLHTVSARATDVVNTTSSASSIQFNVDDTPPVISIDTTGTPPIFRDEEGRWLVHLTGAAVDLLGGSGSQLGSGLESVGVLMEGGPNVVGNGWQTATIDANLWSVDYVLPQVGTGGVAVGNPSGTYTVKARATDAVNNTTPANNNATSTVNVEVAPPIPTLGTGLPITQPITTSRTITGQILVPSNWPIEQVEIAFTPGSNIDALSGATADLPFDENNTRTRYFSDRSGSNNPAGCKLGTCPLVGQAGQRGLALQFDGLTQNAYIADDDSIDFGPDDDFTVAVWVYADPTQPSSGTGDKAIVEKWSGGGVGYPYVIRYYSQTGQIRARRYDGQNNPGINSSRLINDGQFHHIAFVKNGDLLSLYIDGVLDGTATDTTTGDTTNNSDLYLGMRGNGSTPFKGSIDELVIHDRALADYEIADLYNYGLTSWDTASFSSGDNPTWSYTIPEGVDGLEGIYQINVRATDGLGNVTSYADQRLWRGEIDTRPPQSIVTASQSITLNKTFYTCVTTDFNLVVDDTCVIQPPNTVPVWTNGALEYTTNAENDPWYGAISSDTASIYKFDAAAIYNSLKPVDISLQSCDAYGHCTVASANSASLMETTETAEQGATIAPRLALQPGLVLDATVLTPTNGTVLTSTSPVTVTGLAIADAGLQSLSVTANDDEVYNGIWPVTPTITNTLWSFTWAPPAEGIYRFETEVTDRLSNAATGSLTTTVYVDTAAPNININPTVLTTTHQLRENLVSLTGSALDSLQVHRVQVSVDGGPWHDAGLAANGDWQWPWPLVGQPDGETFSVSAQATDLAGRTALDTQTVLVDLVPPQTVTVTLAYQSAGGQILPISAGDTLTDAVSLQAGWTASSDGSGIAGYHVGWSQNPMPVLADLTTYPGAGSHIQPVGEAEAWFAHVLVIDGAGNTTTQTLGPVYVDNLLTPDVSSYLNYHGWVNEVCALEGVDRRLAQTHPDLYGDRQQRFYVTWDTNDLRLLWQGANWDHDGDLFIYLDTRPGGSDRLYNPYPDDPNTTIYLPGNLPEPSIGAGMRQVEARASLAPDAGQSAVGADFMIWVESSQQAALYRWDGFAWALQQELDGDLFRMKPGAASSDTDLRLPFTDLGIADPDTAALGLLAVATEENALQLWSTMPVRNPLNSARVVNPLAGLADQHTFPLVRGYFWDSLASGLCPNGRLNGDGRGPTGGPYADSDLQLTISADPVGTTYSYMNDENAWLWGLLFGFEDLPIVPSQLFNHLDTDHPPLGAGQVVTYTIGYTNLGTETATGVKVAMVDWYSLQLSGDSALELGDIPAGAIGSVQITGFIDPSSANPDEREWASLDAYVYDDQYPENPPGGSWSSAPLEWLWSDHRVDVQPPSALSIDAPEFVIPAGGVTVRGQVADESPVSLITLEVLNEDGEVQTVACPDDTPTDGRWACSWDAANAVDGDIFQVRAQATDRFGQSGDWTEWRALEVDSTPPEVSLSANNLLFGPGIHHLTGSLSDERQVGSVYVCRQDGECTVNAVDPRPEVPPGAQAKTGVWTTYLLPPPGIKIDGQAQTVFVYGEDAVGNRSETLTVTYRMDNAPPVLHVNNVASVVPAIGTQLIASGTVSDGSSVDVNVLVDPATGLRQRLKASVVGTDWSFSASWTKTGVYILWVQAIDAAGNKVTIGPYSVLVENASMSFLPLIVQNAPFIPDASEIYLHFGRESDP